MAYGATVAGTMALPHAVDYERPEHVLSLLAAGADPNEFAAVVHAVRRGRGPDTIRVLAEFGPAPRSTRRSRGRRSDRRPTSSRGDDYVRVTELLVAAGAELQPRYTEVAAGPLADWLEHRTD